MMGAIFLEDYADFGAFLDEFKEREGRGPKLCVLSSADPPVLYFTASPIKSCMRWRTFPVSIAMDWVSTSSRLTSAFVVYRRGMTPDLGNISAMWRNHAENFLQRLLDQRLLRCGSGSLCDTRGGACPACIMVSEVTCIGGNQLLTRAALRGGPAPNWEPQDSRAAHRLL